MPEPTSTACGRAWRRSVAALALLLGGCAMNGVGVRDNGMAQPFNPDAVQRYCGRIGCADANRVVAHYFAKLAAQAGGACVVHVLPDRRASDLWPLWQDYLRAVLSTMPGRRIRLYVYTASVQDVKGRTNAQASANVDKVLRFYLGQGVPINALSTTGISRATAFVPPYRDIACDGRPVLEVGSGARMISRYASPDAEKVRIEGRAGQVVVAVIGGTAPVIGGIQAGNDGRVR